MRRFLPLLPAVLLLATPLAAEAQPGPAPRRPQPAAAAAPANPGASQTNRILAVVNGDVVTQSEVRSRARLFALTSGLPAEGELVTRLEPQILKLLIEDRLRLQEIQRRRIPVADEDVARALADIEQRNGLPQGGLRAQLRQAGIDLRVLYDQIRVQIGWSRLMRQSLGPQAEPDEAQVREQVEAHNARNGQPEFLVSEIFIPLDDPGAEGDTQRFVNDVVGRLRQGLPFPVAATQFSQSQTALQGGDMGWVRPEELEPEVAGIVTRMPPGAISNAVKVPGGFRIVALRQKRETGRDLATLVTLRQAFFPFSSPLDPANPTDQQRQQLEKAQALRGGCEAVEAANRGGPRPADPGQVRLETLEPPPLRQLVSGLAPGRASQPIVTPDGIMVIAVCSRETRNLAEYTPEMAKAQLLRDRIELISRQQQRDLRRRAQIEMRNG
ncbi:peptidylprolyl isomerase [Roseomonas sp. BN140053]|uniref:peptidylprolyl isomerase n=1 Tax=Roseomonas sp. BN140053 TaxID=3391898 RepID=UPI0039E9C5CD